MFDHIRHASHRLQPRRQIERPNRRRWWPLSQAEARGLSRHYRVLLLIMRVI
jgi:hypothetical protein